MAVTIRHVLLTLSALVGLTLPLLAFGQQCDVLDWNRSLDKQKAIDQQFNQHATAYNTLLTMYRRQIFLHQEFTEQELESFWRPDKTPLHDRMNLQIKTANTMVEHLDEYIAQLGLYSKRVKQQSREWHQMSARCAKAKFRSNSIAADRYSTINLELIEDILELIDKLSHLQDIYKFEASTLTESKPN
ncbi:hypothetical protein [Vibrio mexicanus]|uniref:hypothetical protein n=1 Tax=Vibrio mexicanus TaxID=1004326 RepID=UPI00063CEB05|nr:hypothetical protein [Vibrio mexicanus]